MNVPSYLIGSKVFVFDVTGKKVLSYVQANNEQIIDGSQLHRENIRYHLKTKTSRNLDISS